MNWTFNQNCQLIIEIPNKNEYVHTLEVLQKDSDKTIYGIFIDRCDSVEVNIEDGLYNYYLLRTNNDDFINMMKTSKDPIKDITSHSSSVGDWSEEDKIFSICKLRKCTIEHEKQAVKDFLSTCNKRNCNKKSTSQSVKDILLISIFVLEHLISQEKWIEAENILESLGSCSGICDNNTITTCCNG